MELKPEIRHALETMDFVSSYQSISDKYRREFVRADLLTSTDMDRVLDTFRALGYVATFHRGEGFYQVNEHIHPDLNVGFNVVLTAGVAEFIWVVRYADEVRLGSPWSIYSRLLIGPDVRIRPPLFRSYDELHALLKEAFSLYEEFKRLIRTHYSAA